MTLRVAMFALSKTRFLLLLKISFFISLIFTVTFTVNDSTIFWIEMQVFQIFLGK